MTRSDAPFLLLALLAACGRPALPAATQSEETTGSGGEAESSTDTSESSTSESESESESSTDTSESESGEASCDQVGYDVCLSMAASTSVMCDQDCPEDPVECEQHLCHWTCADAYHSRRLECAELHCPDKLDEEMISEAACVALAHVCYEAPDCEVNTCLYTFTICSWSDQCPWGFDLDIDYAGSCEFTLPGPHWFPDLCAIELDGETLDVVHEEAECVSPAVGAYYLDQDFDSLRLCPTKCPVFEQFGSLRFRYLDGECA